MEEYFFNIVSHSKVRKTVNGVSVVLQNERNIDIGYNPLVLMDMIPVDFKNILSLNPEEINRIDLVNQYYMKGDAVFDGIISVLSNSGDYAGMNFKYGGKFFKFDLFSDQNSKNSYNFKPGVPDLRRTLYWNPDLILKSQQLNYINFVTGTLPGKYEIIVRSFSGNGEIMENKRLIEVK